MNSLSGQRGEKLSPLKTAVVQYGILIMLLVLSSQLWRMQVLGAENFRLLAEQNRIRKEPILAARGKLFDREGRLLVDNYPSISCFLVREQNHNVDADLPLIAKGLDIDLEQLRPHSAVTAPRPDISPSPSRRRSRPTSRPSLRLTATSSPSWKPSTRNAAFIPATGLQPISSAT